MSHSEYNAASVDLKMSQTQNASVPTSSTASQKPSSPNNKKKKTQRYTRRYLKSLPCHDQIVERLKAGDGYAEIIRWIQSQGYCQDASERSLTETLKCWKKSMAPVDTIMVATPKSVQHAIEKMRAGINEIEEMEFLYKLQKERILIDFDKEKMIGKLFKGTGNEVSIAMSLLVAMAELKQKMGLTEKHLGTLTVDANVLSMTGEKYGNASVQRVLSSPDARRKVLSIVNHVMGHPEMGETMRRVRSQVLAAKEGMNGGSNEGDNDQD